jgi:hypothetical protein
MLLLLLLYAGVMSPGCRMLTPLQKLRLLLLHAAA